MEIVLASLTNIPKYMTGLIFCTTGINIFFLSSSTWLTPYLYSINMTDPLLKSYLYPQQHDWPLICTPTCLAPICTPSNMTDPLFVLHQHVYPHYLYSSTCLAPLSVPQQDDWPLICTPSTWLTSIYTPINMTDPSSVPNITAVPLSVPPSTWLAP